MEQNTTIERKAAKGGLWLAGFKFTTQIFSWAVTVVIARILAPEDYGLMEMATILTGYVAVFNDLGLGSAIIQREDIQDQELSSLFYIAIFWGCLLALICLVLAYPTAAILNDARMLRITQTVSLLFIIGSFSIVSIHILHRELRFKVLGLIEALAVMCASIAMLFIAKAGGGVWTLVLGMIVRESARVVLVFCFVHWRPRIHFDFKEVKPYLKFGLNLVGAQSLYYLYMKSDSFFGGKILGANALGYYTMALQLSAIPLDKVISLINSVSFPVFSRYQYQQNDFNDFFLKLVKIIGSITIPVFVAGFLLGDQLIALVLGEKWMRLIPIFKILCIGQIFVSITIPSGTANMAQGRVGWTLYMSMVNLILFPISFYLAAKHGLEAMVIPWITIIPIARFVFTLITLRKLGISFIRYCISLLHPLLATGCMIFAILFLKGVIHSNFTIIYPKMDLAITMAVSACTYMVYCVIFQRAFVISILSLMKSNQ